LEALGHAGLVNDLRLALFFIHSGVLDESSL
jgi:hypothetical protein